MTLPLFQAQLLLRRLDDLKDGSESTRESMEINEADFRWQRQVLSSENVPYDSSSFSANMAASERSPDISISITTETGQTTTGVDVGEHGLGQTTPEECDEEPHLPSQSSSGGHLGPKREPMGLELGGERGGKGHGEGEKRRASGGGGFEKGGTVPPDVVQRSHALVYPDITNFLSVESRTHHGGVSRYSESNFRCVRACVCVHVHVCVCVVLLLLYVNLGAI